MKDVGSDYEAILSTEVSSKSTAIPFYSSVTGKRVTEAISLGPSYWRQNLESPVLFHSAVQASLTSQPKDHLFLEVGPHSALAGPLRQIFKDKDSKADLSYLPTLIRGKDCTESILKAVGQLHLQSIPVDFSFLTPVGNVLTDLPLYQWQHDNVYWNEGRLTQDWYKPLCPQLDIFTDTIIGGFVSISDMNFLDLVRWNPPTLNRHGVIF